MPSTLFNVPVYTSSTCPRILPHVVFLPDISPNISTLRSSSPNTVTIIAPYIHTQFSFINPQLQNSLPILHKRLQHPVIYRPSNQCQSSTLPMNSNTPSSRLPSSSPPLTSFLSHLVIFSFVPGNRVKATEMTVVESTALEFSLPVLTRARLRSMGMTTEEASWNILQANGKLLSNTSKNATSLVFFFDLEETKQVQKAAKQFHTHISISSHDWVLLVIQVRLQIQRGITSLLGRDQGRN